MYLYGSTYISPYQKSYAAVLQFEMFQQPLLLNNVYFSNQPSPDFKSSLYLFQMSSLPSSVALASHQASLPPSME